MDADTRNRRNRNLRRLCREVKSLVKIVGPLRASFKFPEKERLYDSFYFAAEIANERRKVVFTRFQRDFNCFSPGQMPRSNEVHACDHLNYFKKMVTWLEEAVKYEAVVVYGLLSPNLLQYMGLPRTEDPKVIRDYFGASERLRTDVLNLIFDIFCVPVQGLGEIIFKSQLNLTTSYELSVVLETVIYTLPEVFGDFVLRNILKHLHDNAHRIFRDRLDDHREKLLQLPLSVPVNLYEIPAMVQGVLVLVEMIKIHDRANLFVEKLPYELVVSHLLAPILQMCDKAMMVFKSNEALGLSNTGSGQLHKLPVNVPSTDEEPFCFLKTLMENIAGPLLLNSGCLSLRVAVELHEIMITMLTCLTEHEMLAIAEKCSDLIGECDHQRESFSAEGPSEEDD